MYVKPLGLYRSLYDRSFSKQTMSYLIYCEKNRSVVSKKTLSMPTLCKALLLFFDILMFIKVFRIDSLLIIELILELYHVELQRLRGKALFVIKKSFLSVNKAFVLSADTINNDFRYVCCMMSATTASASLSVSASTAELCRCVVHWILQRCHEFSSTWHQL